MKKLIGIICGAFSLILALSASAQVQQGRIVTIDLSRVFNEYHRTPVASAKLKETADKFNKEQEELISSYRELVDELNDLREEQDKPEYTDEVREEKRRKLTDRLADAQKKQREIEEFRRERQKDLEGQTKRMRETILKEITAVVDKESKDAGYMLVLDKSGNSLNGIPTVVFTQNTLDITEEIIKILNKNHASPLGSDSTPSDSDE